MFKPREPKGVVELDQLLTLAPRQNKVHGRDGDALPETEVKLPLERWQQHLWFPCENPSVLLYSLCCCCCAMGDVGCYTRDKCCWYPVYCFLAPCPCCVGEVREQLAGKHNLPVASWEPEDCGWCLVKCVGMRLLCCVSVCMFPCAHVVQMRAEVAYRNNSKVSVCPCCCCSCGEAPAPNAVDDAVDYPRN